MNRLLKRAFDILFSALGILLLAPAALIIAGIILVRDGRPVFFRQERVGLRGRAFKILKFRTMRQHDGVNGLQITVKADARVTSLGSILRKYKIDELPQLINVLLGDMSFVGPRPEVSKYVAFYSQEQKRVLEVRPGITDPASIYFRNEAELLSNVENAEEFYVSQILPKKLSLNLTYVDKANLVEDLKLIIQTIKVIIFSNTSPEAKAK